MKTLCIVLLLALLAGCATWDAISPYVPNSPVTLGTGTINVLKVIDIEAQLGIHNPFSESASTATPVPAPSPSPLPPAVVTPPPVTPPAPGVPACGCSLTFAPYKGTKESIFTGGPTRDLRCLMNDKTEYESWVTDLALDHIHWNGNIMTVDCFDVAPGIRAHFVGWRQPSSMSDLRTDNPAVIGSGTLRLYFVSRKATP